jgi:hypothetical protein
VAFLAPDASAAASANAPESGPALHAGPALVPARSSLPGIVQRGRWRAIYTAIPAAGVTWTASFKRGSDAALASTAAIIISSRFPGGSGWQSLPGWLPQQNAVWHAELMWVLRPPATIAPVPTLPVR